MGVRRAPVPRLLCWHKAVVSYHWKRSWELSCPKFPTDTRQHLATIWRTGMFVKIPFLRSMYLETGYMRLDQENWEPLPTLIFSLPPNHEQQQYTVQEGEEQERLLCTSIQGCLMLRASWEHWEEPSSTLEFTWRKGSSTPPLERQEEYDTLMEIIAIRPKINEC